MKALLYFGINILILIVLSLSLIECASLKYGNNTADLKKFKIVVEKTDNGLKMQSVEGSAWTDLSFSLNDYQPQAVDEYGMVELNKISSTKDPNLADFLFTITKTDKGIELKGIEGTAWSVLSFSLDQNERRAFDQYGTAKLN